MRVRIYLLLTLCLLIGASAYAEGEEPTPLDKALKGKILSLDEDMVEIHYDLTDEVQLQDWVQFKPFRVDGDLELAVRNNSFKMKGTGALHHAATFRDKVAIEFDLVPASDRDMGVVISEHAEGEQYVLYSVNDIYFQKFDGGRKPQHMVTRFGVVDPSEPSGNKVFRYVARGQKPEIKPHQKVHLIASKEGKEDSFTIGESVYKGREPGRVLSELHVGFYVVKSNAQFTGITIRGRLSPKWLEKANVSLALSEPLQATGPSEADINAQRILSRFDMGTVEGVDVLEVIGDVEVSLPLREAAVQSLITVEEKTLVPKAVGLLYSEDLDTRILGKALVRGLTKKNFGYDPKGDTDKRSTAIQKIIQYIQKKPGEFGTNR
jgi:hypothetical protein